MENEREDLRESLLRSDEGGRRSFWSTVQSQAIAIGLTRRNVAILSGPVACVLVLRFVDIGDKSGAMLGALCWIFIWWMTEAVPMAITSLAPLYLFPLLGIQKADSVARSYMNDVIALVIGSFILAIAVEEYGIHKRLALHMVVAFSGKKVSPPLLLLGFCGATAFVSMWMHNVAAAVLMMPVATGVLTRLMGAQGSSSSSSSAIPISVKDNKGCEEDGLVQLQEEEIVHRDLVMFCKAVVLGVTYAAAIGGMSTLTGTGVNLILVGMWQSYFPSAEPITFMDWFLFAFPMAFVLFLCLWGILCVLYCSKTSAKSLSGSLDKSHIKMELESLGKLNFLFSFLSMPN